MEQKEFWATENEEVRERYELCMERVRAMKEETSVAAPFYDYFQHIADFIMGIEKLAEELKEGQWENASLEELKKLNHNLYSDIVGDAYEASYANPAVAVRRLGEGYGQILSFLYTEIRGMIAWAYEQRLTDITIVTAHRFLFSQDF